MIHYLYCIKLLGVVIYVGVTKNPVNRFQKHRRSKKPIGRILRKYDERAWIEVLAVGQRNYIYDLEVQAIVAFNTRKPNGFNIGAGGWGCRDPLPSTRVKMSTAIRKAMRSPETRAKMSAVRMGNTNGVGRIQSADTRVKISIAATGRTHSIGARLKMSLVRSGKPHSLEHRAKLSEAARNRWALARLQADGRALHRGCVVDLDSRLALHDPELL